jgi:hypothetical protein
MAGELKWKPEFVEQVKLLCKLGATNNELAEFFGVCRDTIQYWQRDREDFREAIREGKALADARVANALFQRAIGYSHHAVKHFIDKGQVITEPYIEHYPPDTVACIFWLKNRRPDIWRDQQGNQEIKGEKPEPISVNDRIRLIEASKTKK